MKYFSLSLLIPLVLVGGCAALRPAPAADTAGMITKTAPDMRQAGQNAGDGPTLQISAPVAVSGSSALLLLLLVAMYWQWDRRQARQSLRAVIQGVERAGTPATKEHISERANALGVRPYLHRQVRRATK